MTYIDDIVEEYKMLITDYLKTKDINTLLDAAHDFSERAIDIDISPDEMIALHIELIDAMPLDDYQSLKDSLDILQEVMIHFGFTYKDYKAMLNKLERHDQEMDVAASLQETMLKTSIPSIEELEIGAISVPARKVSGDYYNIIEHKDDKLTFAVADVIGKGIPAAIAMSMLKFGMDMTPSSNPPSDSLVRLNQLVEKNVNKNMFVTMFYGLYDFMTGKLCFSSAGHEPAFVYRHEEDDFEEIDGKGLVLGVLSDTSYEEVSVELGHNDMVFVYTDGVSELRKHDESFIDMEDIKDMIRESKDQHPQDIVQYIYENLTRMRHQSYRDDLTMFIIKNKNTQ
ncbi:PP2C family protein-serine/threonine phosphatase [Jeotgalicoccus meleagridis]|uniref:Phosphoserine phosphatase RsbU n=1 Tax=Jeotgalicoccus meleagridis TaxID=2759181 RepID=A0A6V7R8H8_9STAP|nr:PP2C family protein-serine/threonine phosphatase [Jeotgalicoccus meleagridis]CAD2073586.1 Phosphoserine phosphatase RsbU [Jeotgalicoccus meleagridis]